MGWLRAREVPNGGSGELMVYDENSPYLGDGYEGDSVTIVSNVGGRKDRNFARNWSWAKYAADRGVVKRIVVQVVANGETYRTVDAFKRAIGAGHPSARALVTHATRVEDAMAIVDQVGAVMPLLSTGDTATAILEILEPVSPELAVEPAPADDASEPALESQEPPQAAESPPEVEAFDAGKAEDIAAIT